MNELLSILDTIAARDNWVGEAAAQARIFIRLQADNKITKESAIHNLATIQKMKSHNVTLLEFEQKLELDSLLSQITDRLSDA